MTNTLLPPAPFPTAGDVLRINAGLQLVTVRSYESGREYVLGRSRDLRAQRSSYECLLMADLQDPVLETVERSGTARGVRFTWNLDLPPDDLEATVTAEAVGETFAGASVAVTTEVFNRGPDPARIGARLMMNPDIVPDLPPGPILPGSAGPNIALRPPDPAVEPFLDDELEWPSPPSRAWEAYGVRNPSRTRWLYFNGGSLRGTSTLQPPADPPELFQAAIKSAPDEVGIGHSCFDYEIPDPPRQFGGDFGGADGGVAYYWGRTESDSVEVPVGESVSFTTHVFAYLDYPVRCEAGGAYRAECTGPETPVEIDGGASEASDGSPLAHLWTSPDPDVVFEDPASAATIAMAPGVGAYPLDLLVEVGPYGHACSATAEVLDTTPPVLDVPALVVGRTSQENPPRCAVRLDLRADVNDLCWGSDVEVTNSHTSGGNDASGDYPVGETLVRWRAVDPSGNIAEAETLVRVIDDTPPEFTALEARPDLLWPPNHRMVEVSANVEARDNCDPAPEIRLLETRSSEPEDALGDGHTSEDIAQAVTGTADFEILLRAERAGIGAGRTYTLVYEVADENGNATLGEAHVRVPHDRRAGPQ